MQRWHLTAGLGLTALLAVVLAPRLIAPTPTAAPSEARPAPSPPLHLDARLDHGAVLADQTTERFLTITLSADEQGGEIVRRPLNLGVLLDGSGSMTAGGKMHAAKDAAKQLINSMGPADTFSLVVFNDDARTIIPAGPVHDPEALHRQIDGIYEGGGTNLGAGIERAAEQLRRNNHRGAVSRLVILSDGHANVGFTDPGYMGDLAQGLATEGISVSTVGLGLSYNEDLLARLADLGGGSYTFVGEAPQLDKAFAETYRQSAAIVARQTAIRVEIPDHVELVQLIGWEPSYAENGVAIVHMGDIYAGDQRKIVARVRVQASGEGEIDVAHIHASYHDLNEGMTIRSRATATAAVTTAPAAVARSLDPEATEAATRAWASWHMEQSTRAFADGKMEESKRLIAEGQELLEAAARRLHRPSLGAEAEELRQLGTIYDSYAPSSREGKRAIKGGKEMFRGRAR